jgi:hypothetical protein
MNEDGFYLRVAYALSGCQLVEQELKLYIAEALELAAKCINGKMPFKMKGEDCANYSLERLIETFKKLSTNDGLVRDLSNFKEERNFLSHRGITHCLDHDEQLSNSMVEETQSKLQAIQIEADRLRIAIHEEANKFRGYLWFDDLTENS